MLIIWLLIINVGLLTILPDFNCSFLFFGCRTSE